MFINESRMREGPMPRTMSVKADLGVEGASSQTEANNNLVQMCQKDKADPMFFYYQAPE